MYSPAKRAYGISVWGLAAVMGPVLGPLVGGFAAQHLGWRYTIWELMWLSGFCLIFLFFCLPETSTSNILFRRTRRLRNLVDKEKYPVLKCAPEIEGENISGKEIAIMILVRPFTMSLFEPILLALNLYIALLYALLYIWFESFPIVFIGIYGFNESELGLAFIGVLVGAFIVVPGLWWYLHKYTEPQFRNGELKPELRLPPACFGGFCIPICLFWSVVIYPFIFFSHVHDGKCHQHGRARRDFVIPLRHDADYRLGSAGPHANRSIGSCPSSERPGSASAPSSSSTPSSTTSATRTLNTSPPSTPATI